MNERLSDETGVPMQCPPSHRLALRISTTIILLLLLAIVALGAYVFFSR